ncbi:MAG: heavy metal-associated domain-containing protein [Pseudomonadota bacterium]
MKTLNPSFIKKFTAACILWTGASGLSGTAFAAESVKVSVNGMVCAFCAQGIEKGLMSMPAAKVVFVDLKKKIVAIEAKDGQKLDPKTITTEIVDAGYDVVKLETVQLSVADIKAALNAQK